MGKQFVNQKSQSISKYLEEIAKINLLSADEEIDLALKIQSGDESALEKLVKANLRFVVSVAKQYQNQGLTLTDLISEGNLGLFKAAQRFDPSKGFKFISYAVWWIRQSIMQAISEQSRMVRLPLNRISTIKKIVKTNNSLEQGYERSINIKELAKELDMNETDVLYALEISGNTVSLDAEIFEGNENKNNLLDFLPNDLQYGPDSLLMKDSLKNEMRKALTSLTEKEAVIIQYYFGIDRENSLTLEEIGEILGLTRERIRQIKEKALRKLRRYSHSKNLQIYLG